MTTKQSLEKNHCNNCNTSINTPVHCGQDMQLTNEGYWVCWKGDHGSCCSKPSVLEFTSCCDNPNIDFSN